MRRSPWKRWLAVPTVIAAAFLLAGSGVVQPAKPIVNKSEEKKSSVVDYGAVRWKASEKTQTVELKGNVWFKHEDTVLKSDEVTYSKKSDTAVSPGNLRITNPECDITGDKGRVDFKKRLGVIEGNVVMVIKPKEAQKKQTDKESIRAKLKKPTTIACPKLEYKYKAKMATATGGVTFEQEKRSGRADKAVYDQKKELLTLVGNVRGVDEEKQIFTATEVVISLKKGDEWMEAKNASASFKIDVEEEHEESKQQSRVPSKTDSLH